jgi:hypothetical protein
MPKGIKFIRNKKGKPKKLIIDINRYYSLVEIFLDTVIAESRLKEKGIPAEVVYKEIEAKNKIKNK